MAVYLYNLIFSLSSTDTPFGRFQQYPTALPPNPSVLNMSSAWFTYKNQGTPNDLGDYFTPVTTVLTPTDWGSHQPDTGSISLSPGDYLMMRVSSLDSGASAYRVRVTGVFGRGLGEVAEPATDDLQSPLVMSTPTSASSLPRAVVDVDTTGGSTPGSSWPTPITADTSWVNWLGAVHAPSDEAANDYTFNVGISVYGAGSVYTFGKDPRMHVGAGMDGKRRRFAA
jgi:hypothetical protein